jgi:L-lactate dehydrogenase
VIFILDEPMDALVTAACMAARDHAYITEGASRIFGIGTWPATIRFRRLLADRLRLPVDEIRAFVVGERARTEFPLWSSATAAGVPVHLYAPSGKRPLTVRERVSIFEHVRDRAQELDALGGSGEITDARAAVPIIETILGPNTNTSVFPLSTWQGAFILDEEKNSGSTRGDVPCAFSRPVILTRNGIERVIDEIPLNPNEHAGLQECARSVRHRYAEWNTHRTPTD